MSDMIKTLFHRYIYIFTVNKAYIHIDNRVFYTCISQSLSHMLVQLIMQAVVPREKRFMSEAIV